MCQRWKLRCCFGDRFASGDEVLEELFIDAEITFILTLISDLMAFGEHAPYSWSDPNCEIERLKNDIAISCAISPVTKRGKRKRVRRVISEVESTFEREAGIPGISKSDGTGANEPQEFVGVWRLLF
jgi:hypothetical protein